DSEAIGDWAENWIRTLVKQSGVTLTRQLPVAIQRWVDQVEEFATRRLLHDQAGSCRLADAQFIIARSHGFESWARFARHLAGLTQKDSTLARFEAAADAIISGDIKKLKRLLRADPKLIKARSTREHRATLLHYVSANGVEGYRQKTPANAVEIAEVLLGAGAEVDAEADVYGGGATTLGLVATSVHPHVAGVQNPLMQKLLDHGAAIDHQTSAGNRQDAVTGCLANGQGQADVYRAETGARLSLPAHHQG